MIIISNFHSGTKLSGWLRHWFDALLANYNWSSVFNTSGIDRKVNTFLQITENMISEYFPEKTVRIYSKDKPFMTSKIKRLILKRNIKKTKKLNL